MTIKKTDRKQNLGPDDLVVLAQLEQYGGATERQLREQLPQLQAGAIHHALLRLSKGEWLDCGFNSDSAKFWFIAPWAWPSVAKALAPAAPVAPATPTTVAMPRTVNPMGSVYQPQNWQAARPGELDHLRVPSLRDGLRVQHTGRYLSR